MPIRPASRSNQVLPLISWRPTYLDPHIGYPALRLPISKVPGDELLDDPLALQILAGDAAKFVVVTFALLLAAHPLYAVETLLEDVIGPRLEVGLLPLTQAIANGPVGSLVITTQRRDLGLVIHATHLVYQVRFPVLALATNSTSLRSLHFCRANASANVNVVS